MVKINLSLLSVLLAFVFVAGCQSFQPADAITRIVLVRHAEKGKGKNPGLTEKGKQRAEALTELVKIYNIKGVYSSDYNRTKETATPLSKRIGSKVVTRFSPVDYKGMLANIGKDHWGQDVLVVGHSNTVPGFVNFLIGKEIQKQIAEDDFSNLFVVKLGAKRGEEKPSLKTYRYEASKEGALEIKAIP